MGDVTVFSTLRFDCDFTSCCNWQKSQLTETMDKICGLENKMDRWEYKMEKLENKMGGWESNMKGLESKMKGLEAQAEATNEMLQKIMAALNVRDK